MHAVILDLPPKQPGSELVGGVSGYLKQDVLLPGINGSGFSHRRSVGRRHHLPDPARKADIYCLKLLIPLWLAHSYAKRLAADPHLRVARAPVVASFGFYRKWVARPATHLRLS